MTHPFRHPFGIILRRRHGVQAKTPLQNPPGLSQLKIHQVLHRSFPFFPVGAAFLRLPFFVARTMGKPGRRPGGPMEASDG
jgi:hypothetical protein